MIRRLPSKQKNSPVHRERDPNATRKLAALLLCGLLLSSGFVYAAQQHFAALQLGYRSESLRRERDRLLEEQHKLLLQREEAASPARLERAARQIGMQAVEPAQIGSPKDPKDSPNNTSPAVGPATTNSSASAAKSTGTGR